MGYPWQENTCLIIAKTVERHYSVFSTWYFSPYFSDTWTFSFESSMVCGISRVNLWFDEEITRLCRPVLIALKWYETWLRTSLRLILSTALRRINTSASGGRIWWYYYDLSCLNNGSSLWTISCTNRFYSFFFNTVFFVQLIINIALFSGYPVYALSATVMPTDDGR